MADDSELVKAGVEGFSSAAFKGVNALLQSLLGPAAEEAGLMLKDHVRVFRAERQLCLYRRTIERLQKMDVRPQRVPLKLLFPIVENASMEESDELQDRWANLLAHAAEQKNRENLSQLHEHLCLRRTPLRLAHWRALSKRIDLPRLCARAAEEKRCTDLSADAGQPRAQPRGCARSQRTCRADGGTRDGNYQDQGSLAESG